LDGYEQAIFKIQKLIIMKKVFSSFRSYWIQDVSFITLLFVQIFIVFLLPIFIENGVLGMNVLNILILALFFVGIWSANSTRLVLLSAALFLLHLILKLIRFSDSVWEFPVFEQIVAVLNTIVFIMINLNLLFWDDKFNFDRVLGAINVYLLFALLGAFLFEIIYLLTGSSIEGNLQLQGTDEDFVHYIYYSLVSLTTVGYGDIFPANHSTRMLSVLLSSLGMLYPAVIIARLVSSARSRSAENQDS
jgi:hypothetical protein